MKRFIAILIARNLEFFRDRANISWNLMVPVLLIFGFAFAFSGGGGTIYKIGMTGKPAAETAFLKYKYIKTVDYESPENALNKLSHHQLDLVIDPKNKEYYVNESSANGYVADKMLQSDPVLKQKLARKTVSGTAIRYVDWFVPGVIGMNILFGCLVGVGYVIVRYRRNGVLKRFKATPLHAFEFISAQVLSRFFIVIVMSTIIFAGTNFFLHFRMAGSYLDLILVTAMGILCMISLGLLLSARFKSEEVSGGIRNLITFPMMLMSGIFFSLEGTPLALRTVSKIFPITHFIEAVRAIMLDGAGLAAVSMNLMVLGAMTAVFLTSAALLFRWE